MAGTLPIPKFLNDSEKQLKYGNIVIDVDKS